jgi:DNA-binding XRE family transcriptional regulator
MLAHPLLLKAARIILEWDQPTLAKNADVSLSVITNLEKGRSISAKSWLKTQQALEAGGISFVPELESGLGAGLRVQKRLSTKFSDSAVTRNRPPKVDSEDRS